MKRSEYLVGFDFRVDSDFFDHPKTRILETEVGSSGVLALLHLWGWATKYRPTGDLTGVSDRRLCAEVRWRGKKPLLDILTRCAYVSGTDGSRELRDWRTHQPWVATREQRKAKAKLNAQKRWDDAMLRASTSIYAPQQAPAGPSRPQQAQQEHGVGRQRDGGGELCAKKGPYGIEPVRLEPKEPPPPSPEVMEVVAAWLKKYPATVVLHRDEVRAYATKRLAEGFGVTELLHAVEGNAIDELAKSRGLHRPRDVLGDADRVRRYASVQNANNVRPERWQIVLNERETT